MGAALIDDPAAAPEIENAQAEDCLYLNIWVPAGTPPESGWPVQVFIHGGWLQIGDANQTNSYDPFDLLANSTPRIIVAPTYRLNIFGFLAGKELQEAEPEEPAPGNYGLWDQRAALEWIYANIGHFHGNRDLITLYYDTYQPAEKRIIKQAYFWSNAIAVQPNTATAPILTDQWYELINVLSIKADTPKGRLAALRAVPAKDIVAAIAKLKMHTFRTSTDEDFVPDNLLRTIHDGSFAALLAEHGVRIMLGEVKDEALLYKLINPPSTYSGLKTQVQNYYPKHVVDQLLSLTEIYDIPSESEKGAEQRFTDVFASIVADMQVHSALRGMTKCLLAPSNGTKDVPEVLRYRIAWRAKGLDRYLRPEVGVCHAADNPIWWLSGYRAGFKESDRKAADEFLRPFGEFLEGKSWKTKQRTGEEGARRIDRYINAEGVTEQDVEDRLWEKGIKVWDAVAEVQGVK
ncbi:hypothetical protein LTR64_006526 [Lithohypha guttulata]|uniref:Carboxylesterase type B domain-containing protein n=1 Tax=Lithohypha guttulata TaxID=1690604 RepID=A0AAN7T700_9EURO|nr:hypothetical protein LTR51_004916 [Lithohypha guttulata]KAK5091523.1 hypothetical protein LTR05_001707 [Lithohypha guttulata]